MSIREIERATSARPDTVSRATPRSQAQRRDEAERRILEAAADIVAEDGLDGLTLANAGQRAGYSRGLPGHYFRSKDDLVSALVRHIIDLFIAGRRALGQQAGFEGLLATIEAYLELPLQRPKPVRAFHAVLAAALHAPEIAKAVADANRVSAHEIADAIRAGISSGEVRPDVDPDLEGVLILAGLRGLVAQWLADPEGVDLPRLRRGFVASLKRRLQP